MNNVTMTISNISSMPQDIFVKRSDPAYMAHAYLTKVPVAAIEPFIKAFTEPGDIVVDPFAGSGMTGVAAAVLGRRSRLFDISVLGRHIGSNYLNIVEPEHLRKAAHEVMKAAAARVGEVYAVPCAGCGRQGTLAKATWSILVACPSCGEPINFYQSMESAHWRKSSMACPGCGTKITSKARRVGEVPVLDSIDCSCSPNQLNQPPQGKTPEVDLSEFSWPDVEISSDRQMYQASALGKHGLTTIASFYSLRNFAILAALREAIDAVEDEALRSKLLFAFTAILTRASKRYQWSLKRPLNAANANYYVAPVFYEWNVFDLFGRKVESALRSDEWLRESHFAETGNLELVPDADYAIASADAIPLPEASVDYVFTDPPFGSNLFYADMALFQEAWLDGFTDHKLEAVIDRGPCKKRDSRRYEKLLTGALSECRRILRPYGYVTMVFGNSTGAVWALVQRAVSAAGLVIEPTSVAILNKGQRSVKGLASGFEHVATMDLILSMRERRADDPQELHAPTASEIDEAVVALLDAGTADSPSHLYLELLRHGIGSGWDLSTIDLRDVTAAVRRRGWAVDEASGRLRSIETVA